MIFLSELLIIQGFIFIYFYMFCFSVSCGVNFSLNFLRMNLYPLSWYLCKLLMFLLLYRLIVPTKNIIKHNLPSSMNEWIHFFIKNMHISHFILERVNVSVVCERWVETGTDCYIDPNSSVDHSSTSSASWLGLLHRGSLRVSRPSLWPSCLHMTQLPPAPAYILS